MNSATLTGLAIALFGVLGVALLAYKSEVRGKKMNPRYIHVVAIAGIATLTILLLAIVGDGTSSTPSLQPPAAISDCSSGGCGIFCYS